MTSFALICIDKPDSLALRMANREAHLAYIRAAPAGFIRTAGPFLERGRRDVRLAVLPRRPSPSTPCAPSPPPIPMPRPACSSGWRSAPGGRPSASLERQPRPARARDARCAPLPTWPTRAPGVSFSVRARACSWASWCGRASGSWLRRPLPPRRHAPGDGARPLPDPGRRPASCAARHGALFRIGDGPASAAPAPGQSSGRGRWRWHGGRRRGRLRTA